MGTGALSALSTASMMARGAALSSAHSKGIAPPPAPAPIATSKESRQKAKDAENIANLKKAVKVARVASRVLRIAGVPIPW